MAGKGEISIWFFIGMSLLVNGALICGAGIYEYIDPPLEKVVLFDVHAAIDERPIHQQGHADKEPNRNFASSRHGHPPSTRR